MPMKTSINFYVDDLKPKKYFLTLTNTAILTSIALLMMLVWLGTLLVNNHELENKNSQLTVQLDGLQLQLNNYQEALVNHNNQAAFKRERDTLIQTIDGKKTLLKIVTERTSDEAVDYYQVMKDLTEHHDHDLWLTQFTFNKNQVSFNGYALQSKAVTNWLSYLQATTTFSGREFSLLEIRAHDENVVEFKTATTVSDNDTGGSFSSSAGAR